MGPSLPLTSRGEGRSYVGRVMEVVRLSPDEADLFVALDRSEIVDGLYRRVEGGLLLCEHSETITGWPAGLLDKYCRSGAALPSAGAHCSARCWRAGSWASPSSIRAIAAKWPS
jgi:hypothetical protein